MLLTTSFSITKVSCPYQKCFLSNPQLCEIPTHIAQVREACAYPLRQSTLSIEASLRSAVFHTLPERRRESNEAQWVACAYAAR